MNVLETLGAVPEKGFGLPQHSREKQRRREICHSTHTNKLGRILGKQNCVYKS